MTKAQAALATEPVPDMLQAIANLAAGRWHTPEQTTTPQWAIDIADGKGR